MYQDRWISRQLTFKVFSSPTPSPTLGVGIKVQDLKLPSGGWNKDLIHEYFLLDDTKMILSLLCVSSPTADSLIWHYDKLGSYSMKGRYHLGCELVSTPSSSGLSQAESWWKFLWSFKIPTKVKIHIWKA